MLSCLFWICFFTITMDIKQCWGESGYQYNGNIQGWVKVHTIPATHDDAVLSCESQGAVLLSPNDVIMRAGMISIMESDTQYHIGTKFVNNKFISEGGVPLEYRWVNIVNLELKSNECLSLGVSDVKNVACTDELPYICLKKAYPDCGGDYDDDYTLKSTGSCYKVHTARTSWTDARSICEEEGGYLAVINDSNETAVVHSMYPQNVSLDTDWHWDWYPMHVGLEDPANTGSWRSINGQRFELNWEPGQPAPTPQYTQYCAAMIRKGTLDNVYCSERSFFICERDPNSIKALRERGISHNYTTY